MAPLDETLRTETATFSEKNGHENIENAITGDNSSAESKKIINVDGVSEDVTPVSSMGRP